MSDGTRIRVIYDGECALCRGARSWVENRDREDQFRFEPCDSSLPDEEMVLTVEDATGDRFGYQGWVAILERLPRWRRLAGVLRTRPINLAGSAIYRVVAACRGHLKRSGRPRLQ